MFLVSIARERGRDSNPLPTSFAAFAIHLTRKLWVRRCCRCRHRCRSRGVGWWGHVEALAEETIGSPLCARAVRHYRGWFGGRERHGRYDSAGCCGRFSSCCCRRRRCCIGASRRRYTAYRATQESSCCGYFSGHLNRRSCSSCCVTSCCCCRCRQAATVSFRSEHFFGARESVRHGLP